MAHNGRSSFTPQRNLTLTHDHYDSACCSHSQNPNADAKTVKSLLKQSNPAWGSIPERRVKKILSTSAESSLQESAKTKTSQFSFAKGASKLFAKSPTAVVDDTATAPLDSPPAEVACVEPAANAAVTVAEPLAAEEKAAPADATGDKATVAQDENVYKDDNDGQRNDCAVCQSCTVM